MKILYYTNIPAPYKVEFLNEIVSKGHNVTMIYDEGFNEKRDEQWYKNNIYKFDLFKIKKIDYFGLKRLINKIKYDAFINDNYASINGLFLSNITNGNYYLNVDGGVIGKNDNLFVKYLKTHFISKAKYYFSSGKETNKYLLHYGAKEEKIFEYPFTSILEKDILNYPINYKKKRELRKKEGYDYNKLFISVGRFIDCKGYELFFDAINERKLDGCGFIIVGGGELKEKYQEIIAKYKLHNVHLIDFVQKRKIFEYYQMSDVFFFPSKGDTWGLVINEAMANALPIISSNRVVGANELLSKKFLFDTFNIEEQFSKIKLMAEESNEELYNIGKQNLERIKNYTVEKMAKRYIEVLENNSNE